MANVNATVEEIAPNGLTSMSGYKLGYLSSTTKAAQNDTVTITNASEVIHASIQIAATGAAEPNTISGKVITATSATTGSVKGLVLYRV